VKHGGFPWETPAGNGMLGGRPQLTAGIRAGSYIVSVATSAIERQSSRSKQMSQGRLGGMRCVAMARIRLRSGQEVGCWNWDEGVLQMRTRS